MRVDKLIKEFQAIEDTLNDAFCSNNTEEIPKFLSSDWYLLESQYGIINKERFLNAIEQGDLSHTAMRKKVLQVNLYGDVALVTNRGMNNRFYKSNPYNSEQWLPNIYNK